MVRNRVDISTEALKLALKIRHDNKINLNDTFCVFDFAERIGIEVKFVDIPSMEGMLIVKPRQTILISSHRPPGRQCFTCAHELGHYFFKHKVHIDEIIRNINNKRQNNSKEETVADIFASFFLMPSTTVSSGFIRREWNLQTASPMQIYAVACWLGVGYTTLINHMQFGIRKITSMHAKHLLKENPKKIKNNFLNFKYNENIIFVDFEWSGRPIDVYKNDLLAFDDEIKFDSNNLEFVTKMSKKYIYRTVKIGIGQVSHKDESWASFIRVSKRNYIGRCKFRHLEDD